MPLDAGSGPFLAVALIFLNISSILMSLNLSIFWLFFEPMLLITFTMLLDFLMYSFVVFFLVLM